MEIIIHTDIYWNELSSLNDLREKKELAPDAIIKANIKYKSNPKILIVELWSSYRLLNSSEQILYTESPQIIQSIIDAESFKLIGKEKLRTESLPDHTIDNFKKVKLITSKIIIDIIGMWENDFKKKAYNIYLNRIMIYDYMSVSDSIFLNIDNIEELIEQRFPDFGYIIIDNQITKI